MALAHPINVGTMELSVDVVDRPDPSTYSSIHEFIQAPGDDIAEHGDLEATLVFLPRKQPLRSSLCRSVALLNSLNCRYETGSQDFE